MGRQSVVDAGKIFNSFPELQRYFTFTYFISIKNWFSHRGRCRWKALKRCALQVPVCTTFKTLYIIQHLGATAASLATIKFPNYSFNRPSIIAACILQKCSVLSALIALGLNSYSIKGYCAAGHWKTFHRAHRSNYEFFILSGLKSQRHKAALSPLC